MKAFRDMLFMIGLWFIGWADMLTQADLMEKWVNGIRHQKENLTNL